MKVMHVVILDNDPTLDSIARDIHLGVWKLIITNFRSKA